MSVLFADTSALVRAYFHDEVQHEAYRDLVLRGDELVVASAVARVEFASAAQSAVRAGRAAQRDIVLARFDADCQPGGPISLLPFDPRLLDVAHGLVLRHPLRTLDALHLASLLAQARSTLDDVVLLSCDAAQCDAARAEGVRVRLAA